MSSKLTNNVDPKSVATFIENNYGSIYKTTGGGKKQLGGLRVTNFLKKILGNRVLDLYLKYSGLKLMTTATLVPFALILGKDYFESFVKFQQKGGRKLLPKNLPILDDPLVGNYLKLMGISVIKLKASTLLPLGILMVIYDLHNKNKKGGRMVLPMDYFNPKGSSNCSKTKRGGSRTVFGADVPMTSFQKIDNLLNAQTLNEPILHIPRRFPEFNNQLQTTDNNPAPPKPSIVYSSHFKIKPRSTFVDGFPVEGVKDTVATSVYAGDLGDANVGVAEIVPTMAGGSNLEPNELLKERFDSFLKTITGGGKKVGYRKSSNKKKGRSRKKSSNKKKGGSRKKSSNKKKGGSRKKSSNKKKGGSRKKGKK